MYLGGRVSPRASLDAVDMRRISCPKSNPDSSVIELEAYYIILSRVVLSCRVIV
jgi:hypothetical protein